MQETGWRRSWYWRQVALVVGAILVGLGVSGYLVSRGQEIKLVTVTGGSLDRQALVEPLLPTELGQSIKRPPRRPSPPPPPPSPPPPPPPPPPPLPSPVQPEDPLAPIPIEPPADPSERPAEPAPRPAPPEKGEILFSIVEPSPTPARFHQEEVVGRYPARLEIGATAPVMFRFERRMVDRLQPTDDLSIDGDQAERRASIEPIPGRSLEVSLGESQGAGYDAWLRCRLVSPSLTIVETGPTHEEWRPLEQTTSVEWEWQIRANSPEIQQSIEVILEVEWRPQGAGEVGKVKTIRRQLWRDELRVTIADPLLTSGQIQTVSPILGGTGAFLMLIAALPFGRRRAVTAKSAESESAPATIAAANLGILGEAEQDVVECSVFAPPIAPQGETIMIQIFAHLEGLDSEAAELALRFDSTARPRGVKTLSTRVSRGTELTFDLELSRLPLSDPIQTLVWMGDTESVQFIVEIPDDCRLGNLSGKVTISQKSVPIGQISFLLRIVPPDTPLPEAAAIEAEAVAYRSTFISYASQDRDKVLARVQMLDQMGIRYFQDLLSLEPGQRWEEEIYRHIDQCDLFLLFWSNAAKESEWVMREVTYAIERKQGNDDAPPAIKPVIIEGPPLVEPPPPLKHLHFNDRLIYLMTRDRTT